METLEDIKSALNWHNITMGSDGIVIRLDESDMGLIQGLKSNDQCIYLDHPEFQSTIVSFLITISPTEWHQYWVLGDKLHRVDGPAMVSVIETSTDVYTTRLTYYLNGLKHRTTGPAEVVITGQRTTNIHPRTLDEVGSHWDVEEWDSLTAYWFTMGVEANYPLPYSAEYTNGVRIYHSIDSHLLLDDYEDFPAMEVGQVVVNWMEDSEATTFRPTSLKFAGYNRHYTQGVFDHHKCGRLIYANWLTADGPVSAANNDNMRDDLFPNWNIWDGPFFINNQELVFTLQEVAKITNDQQ